MGMKKYFSTQRQMSVDTKTYKVKPGRNGPIYEEIDKDPAERKTTVCPYCAGFQEVGYDKDGYIKIETEGGKASVRAFSWKFDINYCPMCGRKF